MHNAPPMALWIKLSLWVAVIVLPGGLLLTPLLVAVHRRDLARRGEREDRDSCVTPTVTV